MTIETIKFSEFLNGGDLANDNTTVGLESGTNARFNNPWTFLPPGTTGDRPSPAASMYYRLRFNTTKELYEYYNPVLVEWIVLEDEASILALLASHDLGKGASLVGLENQGTIVDKTVQDLSEANFICGTNNGTTPNAQYTSLLDTGIVKNTTGTGELSVLDTSSDIDEVINDDTMATAAVSNIPTALSVKNYVNAQVAGSVTSGQGTANQVLVNGTSGSQQTGDLIFTTPQDIGKTSDVVFGSVTSNGFNVGIDTGIADAYVVNLAPEINSLTDGLQICFKGANLNATNSPTLTVNGITAPIVLSNFSPINIADIGVNVSYLIYSSSFGGWTLLNGIQSAMLSGSLIAGNYSLGVDSGAANAYVVNYACGVDPSVIATAYGSTLVFLPAHTNTSLSSINVNGSSSNVLLMNNTPLPAGALSSSVYAQLIYGYNIAGNLGWILQNPQGAGLGGLFIVAISGTSQAASINTKYFALNSGQTTLTLPAIYPLGAVIALIGSTANTGGFVITASAGDTIRVNNSTTSAGGSVTSAAVAGQTIYLEADVANASWVMTSTVSTTLTTS